MAKLHHEHHSLRSKFPLLIAGAVLALGFAIYQLNSLVHADDVTVSAVIETVLAITAPDKLDLNLTPSSSGTLATSDATVNVSTNNSTGYTLSMSTTTDNTALTHTNGTNSINSTSSPISAPTTLPSNTWGWYPSSLATNPGGSNYQFAAIPSLSSAYTAMVEQG